jgi:hypothetical protein
VNGDRPSTSGFCEGQSLLSSEPVIRVHPHQAKRRSLPHRLGLTFVSKAAQPFGLVLAAVSGVISAQSDMQCRAIGFSGWGDHISVMGFVGGRSSLD